MINVVQDDPNLVLKHLPPFICTLRGGDYIHVCVFKNIWGDYGWTVDFFSSIFFLLLLNFLQSTGIIFRKTSKNVIFKKCIEEKLSKKDWPETNGKPMVPRRWISGTISVSSGHYKRELYGTYKSVIVTFKLTEFVKVTKLQ